MPPSVLIVGSANQDLTAYTSRIPEMGETVMGQDFKTSCGGKGANQAVAASSLAPIRMVCKVGSDIYGKTLLENFRKSGVEYDESTVFAPEGVPTGVAPIVVDTSCGDNTIIVVPGANHVLTPEEVRKAILEHKPKVVLTQLEVLTETALEAMKVGKEVGAITILNPAPAPEILDKGFYKYVDILIPNETELKILHGSGKDDKTSEEDMAKDLLERGISMAVVCTLGARGAVIVSPNGKIDYVSAPKGLACENEPVVDTVGAGDSFCGSLSAYLNSGLDLKESASRACGIASMSVRKLGAQTSYPSPDEIPEELKIGDGNARSSALPALTFVTGNKKKLEEVERLMAASDGNFPFQLTNRKIDLPELQGEPLEIAEEKCRLAAKEVGGAVLTEDTSLCFHALGGLPGPYIKWFLEKCGHEGLNKMLAGFDDKSAYAQTIFAFTTGPDDEIHLFDGRTNGKIVPARGAKEFGWDPVFEAAEGHLAGKTYAEMTNDEKNTISHRAKSMAKLQTFLSENGSDLVSKLG
jgi:ribokinase/non-canonical purine NTP pyrophosphatase (RdgB/HAM1 family)